MSNQELQLSVPLSMAGTRLDASVIQLLSEQAEDGDLPAQLMAVSRNRIRVDRARPIDH